MTDKIETYGWKFTGQKRPDFATVPGAGEESVWDYPRPPAIVDDHREVQVFAADGTLMAACTNSKRVLETASPPTFYLPPEALKVSFDQVDGASYCEWKGQAEYFAYAGHRLAWRYPRPTQAFAEVAGLVFFLSC
jgi:uncharacterized protein (DUF427 family)